VLEDVENIDENEQGKRDPLFIKEGLRNINITRNDTHREGGVQNSPKF
jgi:hypothetical protein